ncbi:MAG: precorrin-6y C5,15-methyltransferase (decarboxylating) subunit CbiE [bacterium]|nr:precorrin-6y C5,15-methyltransferase (decarboxylating) subunit CbiE [bacterium]
MSDKITIIGIGDDGIEGLTQQAVDLIRGARTLVGSQRLIDKLSATSSADQPKHPDQQRVTLPADLEGTARQVADLLSSPSKHPVVLLTGGDPLFYGTARFLCEQLGKDHFEVLPHVSSMQLAFARIKESWDEAYLTNLATQTMGKVVDRIRLAEKVGVFTSDEVTPSKLAQTLLEQGIDYFTAYVCENLGSPDERITRGSLQDIAGQSFGNLNVMILIRLPNTPDRPAGMQGRRVFGNPDDCFLQSQPKRGLLTQCEVRVIALAEMDLGPNSITWDVGAGSGSVAIEAAQLTPGGQVFAIEMDVEDYNLLVENARTFGTTNLTPILGEAPQAWQELPDPHAIFVGGTGRAVVGLVDAAWHRLQPAGRLVVQLAGLDHLTTVEQLLRQRDADPRVLMINLARGQRQMDALRLEAANPSFLLVATKQAD